MSSGSTIRTDPARDLGTGIRGNMKKLNICIIDSDDRGGQAGLPHHYRKLGHNVFMPKPGSPGLDWKRIPIWPRLLMRSQSDPTKRNLDIHGYPKGDEVIFGEDRFIEQELADMGPVYSNEESHAECDLIDFSKEKVHIDAFHTTCNAVTELRNIFDNFVNKYMPNAKWINSSFNAWEHYPLGLRANNICRMLPANYDKEFQYAEPNHACNFYRHHTEFALFGVKRDARTMIESPRDGFASFNHNYHVRQQHPLGYPLFAKVNDILATYGISVPNHGGNIRGHGADVKYAGDNGVTGNYETLSPRQAALKYLKIRAVVHFKNTDWSGGVPAYCRMASTPMITTQHFIDMSHSHDTLIHGYNCVVVNSAEEAVDAILKLSSDDDFAMKLRIGMKEVHDRIFNDQAYWDAWDRMLSNLE